MANLTVSKNGGTITISASSSPSNTISYGTLPSYASRDGNVITVPVNYSYNRTFDLTVTATTVESADYYGTATASSAWTVSQNGDLGPKPSGTTYSIPFVFAASSDFGSFIIQVDKTSGSGTQESITVDGISESGSLGSDWTDGSTGNISVVNRTSSTRQIGIEYTSSPGQYSYTSIAAGGTKTISFTASSKKVIYIQIN